MRLSACFLELINCPWLSIFTYSGCPLGILQIIIYLKNKNCGIIRIKKYSNIHKVTKFISLEVIIGFISSLLSLEMISCGNVFLLSERLYRIAISVSSVIIDRIFITSDLQKLLKDHEKSLRLILLTCSSIVIISIGANFVSTYSLIVFLPLIAALNYSIGKLFIFQICGYKNLLLICLLIFLATIILTHAIKLPFIGPVNCYGILIAEVGVITAYSFILIRSSIKTRKL
jgi:hypothetical protein